MILDNKLFFEQVEAMLGEQPEVQIRMKGHSMRPLLRDGRDIVVLTPVARYADGAALRPGDVVLFRHAGRHILHRIIRIEYTGSRKLKHRDSKSDLNSESRCGEVESLKHDAFEIERITLAGDGNNGATEQCAQGDIVAVMTRIIRPSGRVIAVDSREWRRKSRYWLGLPLFLRRFLLSALWRTGVR